MSGDTEVINNYPTSTSVHPRFPAHDTRYGTVLHRNMVFAYQLRFALASVVELRFALASVLRYGTVRYGTVLKTRIVLIERYGKST